MPSQYHIHISLPVPADELARVFATAVNEGSAYWYQDYAPVTDSYESAAGLPCVRQVKLTQPVREHCEHCEPATHPNVSVKHLAQAISLTFTNPSICPHTVREQIASCWPQVGELDAYTADILLQLCVFERIVYGGDDEADEPPAPMPSDS